MSLLTFNSKIKLVFPVGKDFENLLHFDLLFYLQNSCYLGSPLQDGPLLVINGFITPINDLING